MKRSLLINHLTREINILVQVINATHAQEIHLGRVKLQHTLRNEDIHIHLFKVVSYHGSMIFFLVDLEANIATLRW